MDEHARELLEFIEHEFSYIDEFFRAVEKGEAPPQEIMEVVSIMLWKYAKQRRKEVPRKDGRSGAPRDTRRFSIFVEVERLMSEGVKRPEAIKRAAEDYEKNPDTVALWYEKHRYSRERRSARSVAKSPLITALHAYGFLDDEFHDADDVVEKYPRAAAFIFRTMGDGESKVSTILGAGCTKD